MIYTMKLNNHAKSETFGIKSP